MPNRRRSAILCFSLILLLPLLLFAKGFVKPVAMHAKAYPAHDSHPDEMVAIAADPYDTPQKAAIFTHNLAENGFLPIFFVVTNDGDRPISIADMQITFLTRNNSKLTPMAPADMYRRLTNPRSTTPLPLPIPRKPVKGTISKKEMDEIESAAFVARAVEPRGTQSGFLFFDIGGINTPMVGALIDITGVADAKGHELLYFEISLDKYLNAPVK